MTEKSILRNLEREDLIIRMRFGIDDDTPHTLEETAIAFGLTRERIRQIEALALKERLGSWPGIGQKQEHKMAMIRLVREKWI